MQIPGKKIASHLEKLLKKEVLRLKKKGKKLKLATFLIGESADQISFVAQKRKKAQKLGIGFEFIHLKKTPDFQQFIKLIKQKSEDTSITGIIVQQPLPSQLSTETIYDFIATNKEIEGHKKKTSFIPPLGLAILTLLKYVYTGAQITDGLLIDVKKDKLFFKQNVRNKKIVLAGRGLTGGKPIGQTLTQVGIGYLNINSKTPDPQEYFRAADIIISAVGRKILTPQMLKKDVVLLNIGVRREKGKLRGDYDEKEVDKIAAFYTPTPGGAGPIDVTYLYHNLIQAAWLQL